MPTTSKRAARNLGFSERNHNACGCSTVQRFRPGSSERKYERSRQFEVQHLALDLDILLEQKSVEGTAELQFERRAPSGKALRLDGHGLVISSIELTTKPASGKNAVRELRTDEYSYDGEELVVPIEATVKSGAIKISYRATPRLGLYFLAPDKEVPDRPLQVWSQCQDEDGKHWFFCQDKPHVKMTYEVVAHVPKGMTVLSGGKLLLKNTPSRGSWTYHYRLDEPTPAYLVTLVVGKFDEWSEQVQLSSGRVIDLRFLVPPGRKADGKRAFSQTAEAIRLFSDRTGVEYPYESYSQVVVADFIFGGMENTTATTMYEHILLDKTAAIDIESHDLVAHELAHHWFGDLVTCRDWSHGWLNEGFATYFEHVEKEHRLGHDEYEHSVTTDLNIYLGEARGDYTRPIVCRDYDEPIDLFDRHLYQKGGLVLHMLRKHLGDECFWKGVRRYLIENQGGIVETNDLMRTLEEASGLSLEKFFDQWVYRPGHPSLKVTVGYDDGLLSVDVEQIQKDKDVAVFEFLFEAIVSIGGKQHKLERLISERKSSLCLPCNKKPDWVVVDPHYRVCAPMTLSMPADMLRQLLREGPQARARRMAAHALGDRQDPKTIESLRECLASADELWMVRTKAAESLGKIGGEAATKALLDQASDEHSKIRQAVAAALGTLTSKEAVDMLIKMSGDKSYMVTAASARALGKTRDKRAIPQLRKLLQRNSWSEVIRSGALFGLSKTGEEQVVPTLMEWTQYGRPLRARRAAIAALPQVGEGRAVRDHLEHMLRDRDPHVRGSVISALVTLGDPKAKTAISELLSRELDGGVKTKAKRALTALGKSGQAGLMELRHENQELRRELSDLKTRLSKLEQRSSRKPETASREIPQSSTKSVTQRAKKPPSSASSSKRSPSHGATKKKRGR